MTIHILRLASSFAFMLLCFDCCLFRTQSYTAWRRPDRTGKKLSRIYLKFFRNASGDWLILSEVEDQPALLGILPERLRRLAGLFFKKPDKIGGIFIAQLVGNIFHLVGRSQ